MNDIDGEFYSLEQSTTTPAVVSSPTKDSNVRPHGDMLKMMNPTPNGYSAVPNHKPKPEGQDTGKHHESKNNIDHHKHSSDHVKKKEHDDSKHKNSSHSKSKESSKDSNRKEGPDGHKEKKHKSSHKESPNSKDGSHKHSDHHLKHISEKEDKHKSDSIKKEPQSSEGKPKTDNFKENEKIKDSSTKEHKEKHKEHKEKHKDKHKDREHKEKHKDKSSSSSEKPKEKSDKPKEKSDKPKVENSEKHKEKDKERHKDKHSEKHKDKHSEKHKDKHKDKHSEKHKEKSKEKHEEKSKEKHEEKSKEKHESKHKESAVIKQELEESVQPSSFLDEEMSSKSIVKEERMSDEDIPLMARKASMNASKSIKMEAEDSDDEPISAKIEKKAKSEKKQKKKKPTSDEDYEMEEEKPKPKKKRKADSDDDDDYASKKPVKKVKKEVKKEKSSSKIKQEPITTASPTKRKKKEEEEQEVWKWWEEEKLEDGIKWKTLEHNGPVFAPPYERLPKNVKFYYDGKHMELSELTEEVAGFYGRMLDHEYTSKDTFNNNFFKDWKKVMTSTEKETITDLKKCNFNAINDYYKMKSEERKSMTKEQKAVIKKENEVLTEKYGFCVIDGHKQKIANFKIEPPGLFRGRGQHPKMGMLKKRTEAEDILINIGKEAKVPTPPPGHKWKEVRHDNTVSWLASWSENILGSTKYVMLNPSSKLKGEKDWQKYELARKLKLHADRIREEYTRDFKSKEMKVRQRAVALYFIDKLALRAGNEKDEDTADTVGCCSLRVEHITLDDEKDGQEYVVSFDFLGKDSIRYMNSVPVEKRAYKNLKLFMENKQPGDDLFDRLNTTILNKYLTDLMEGLTAKVFRTYNASKTLQEQLDLLTKEEMSVPEKILAYNRANRAVAILCNHQRAVPKGFSKSMESLKQKMDEKVAQIKELKKDLKHSKQAAKDGSAKEKMIYDKKKKKLVQLDEQLKKLEVQATDKEENKQIALGTSKLNYLDPRISVSWCKKWGVPIEKIYIKTQRDKFRWAIEMAGPDYKF